MRLLLSVQDFGRGADRSYQLFDDVNDRHEDARGSERAFMLHLWYLQISTTAEN